MSILSDQLRPACRRHNHVMAAYVNAAAAIRMRLGPEKIGRFMLEAGVPDHIVLRVSTAGGPRRPFSRFHEFADLAGLGDDGAAASAVYFRASAAQAWGVNKRVNARTAMLVDAAINTAASHGVAGAAAELIDRGFPVDCVFRVLCHPGLRRHYPYPVAPAENWSAPCQQRVCRRRNRLQAAYVDAALRISHLINVERAEAILVEQGVPHGVIVRALHLNGLLRRHGGAGV